VSALAGAAALDARVTELAREAGAEVLRDAPLAPLTWLGIGGPAPYLFTPRRAETVGPLVRGLRALGLEPRWLGAGSNLLIDDRGIDDPVILTSHLKSDPRLDESGAVGALAGAPLPGFTRWLAARGLQGLEFAEGIPGSVGGSVAMNAGAFGQSLGERVARVRLVHADGREEERETAAGDFSYRRSRFAEEGTLVLQAVFRLRQADPADLGRRLEEYREYRRQTQPLTEQSAGCIFRNPADGPSAGALIERCGLKGLARGDARVSEVHANFIVNQGKARFDDVRALVEEVKARVRRDAGMLLEEEIRVWARP
jgi:UDP-N-acetylmuramate dehydrogenase